MLGPAKHLPSKLLIKRGEKENAGGGYLQYQVAQGHHVTQSNGLGARYRHIGEKSAMAMAREL